jgi:hypothetical protein
LNVETMLVRQQVFEPGYALRANGLKDIVADGLSIGGVVQPKIGHPVALPPEMVDKGAHSRKKKRPPSGCDA